MRDFFLFISYVNLTIGLMIVIFEIIMISYNEISSLTYFNLFLGSINLICGFVGIYIDMNDEIKEHDKMVEEYNDYYRNKKESGDLYNEN